MRLATRAVALGVVGLLAILLLLWAHPVGRDSSLLNEDWNGASKASQLLEASALPSYDHLQSAPMPATLVLIPRLVPNDATLQALDAFTIAGGTLVVLDDFGFGNEVLAYLEVDISFHGGILMDPLYCHRHAAMPRVEFSHGQGVGESGVMVLNHATWLAVGRTVEVWARSSYFSYGDSNHDGRRGSGEPSGPLPVGASAVRGGGKVVAVSDASLLLNSMVGLGENLDAVARLVQGDVLLDQMHLPEAEMDQSRSMLVWFRQTFSEGGGAVLLVFLACCLGVGYAWYNRERVNA